MKRSLVTIEQSTGRQVSQDLAGVATAWMVVAAGLAVVCSATAVEAMTACAAPTTPSENFRYVDCCAQNDGDGTIQSKWNNLVTAQAALTNGMRLHIDDNPCDCLIGQVFEIKGKTDVVVESFTSVPVTVRRSQPGVGSHVAFRIENSSKILLKNFEIVALNTQDVHKFQEGVEIVGSVSDVTVEDVTVSAASIGAGIEVTATGSRVCLVDTVVSNAGKSGSKSSAYSITSSSLSNLEFHGAEASTSQSGFALDQSTGVSDALFDGAVATGNKAAGFAVLGGTSVLLNVTARDNGGAGILVLDSARIENAHVVDNGGAGIEANDSQATLRVVAGTLVDNQIGIDSAAATLEIFNTIVSGSATSVEKGTGSATCDFNLLTGVSDCSGSGDVSGTPVFQPASAKAHLGSASPGLNQGRNLQTSVLPWVTVADTDDHDGVNRPVGGVFDIGAFEGPSGVGPPPSGSGCLGDCNADSVVRVSELVKMVNINLGRAELDECPDAADGNSNGQVEVSELVTAVRNNLQGCSLATPSSVTPSRSLTLSDPQGTRGSDVPVDVTISNTSADVAGVQVDILYDPAGVDVIDPDNDCALAAGLSASDYSLASTRVPAGETPAGKMGLRLVLFGGDDGGSVKTIPEGTIARCTFRVDDNAAFTVYDLTTQEVELCNDDADVFQNVTVNQGSVQVCDGCCP